MHVGTNRHNNHYEESQSVVICIQCLCHIEMFIIAAALLCLPDDPHPFVLMAVRRRISSLVLLAAALMDWSKSVNVCVAVKELLD